MADDTLEAGVEAPKSRAELARQHLAAARQLAQETVEELQAALGKVHNLASEVCGAKELHPPGVVEFAHTLEMNASQQQEQLAALRAKGSVN